MKKLLMMVVGMFMNIVSYAIPQQPVQEEDDLVSNQNLDNTPLNETIETEVVTEVDENEVLIEKILKEAKTHIGKKYVWATRGPKTFDCSGFVYYVFKQFDYKLSPSSRNQYTLGTHVDRKNVKKGDLVFFHSRRHPKGVGHVGIVYDVDGDKIYFIHASLRGVTISALEGYYERNLVGFKRVI